jgi:hypothetical protein
LFVSSVLFVFWYHSPNFLDTPRIACCFIWVLNSVAHIKEEQGLKVVLKGTEEGEERRNTRMEKIT